MDYSTYDFAVCGPGEWVGFDFDGTLVPYLVGQSRAYRTYGDIPGPPIEAMLELLNKYLDQGAEVRIITARASYNENGYNPNQEIDSIRRWCGIFCNSENQIVVTNEKTPKMRRLYDDRARQVLTNTGELVMPMPLPKRTEQEFLTVPQILEAAARTFAERGKLYGQAYKDFGHVMVQLFPEGFTARTADDWVKLGLIKNIVAKLTRYCGTLPTAGGHVDSAHDGINYFAMLEEVTKK